MSVLDFAKMKKQIREQIAERERELRAATIGEMIGELVAATFSHTDGAERIYIARNLRNGHCFPVRVKTVNLAWHAMPNMYHFDCPCPRKVKPCHHILATYLTDAERLDYEVDLKEFAEFTPNRMLRNDLDMAA